LISLGRAIRNTTLTDMAVTLVAHLVHPNSTLVPMLFLDTPRELVVVNTKESAPVLSDE
jgi:hypothetical protein